MRALIFCLTSIAIAAATITLMPVRAAQNPAKDRIAPVSAELLVFESKNCVYCFIFRRDVAPSYQRSPRALDVPIRYIDVRKTDLANLQLRAPLTMLPTIVLMKNGREVDRISGYMGPEPFFHMVSQLMR
jgi:thioredoxin-related protein